MFTTVEVKDLAMKLSQAESEDDVIAILKAYHLYSDESCWRAFGDNENNFSVIGAQQSTPEAALVEKLINSVDAVLIRRAMEMGIDPEGESAPSTIRQALEQLFDIEDGKLSSLSKKSRNQLAQTIKLLVTGKKSAPNYIIMDRGEGQSPKRLPETILSLSKSNKLRIPFVQGKFNMGGTGVLQFCGEHNFQLVVSRRCQTIADRFNTWKGQVDPSKELWGVTVVRRSQPKKGARSSFYEYLAPNGDILSFSADALHFQGSPDPLEWGTYIKLYDYRIGTLKTTATLSLYYALSVLLPDIALPVRIIETRDYSGHSLETTLSGLNVRMAEDRSQNLEEGFPYESEMTVNGQKLTFTINVFKEGKSNNYRKKNEGVIFVVNGQTHGMLDKRIYSRKKVSLGYLSDSIITVIDCSGMDLRSREDLFMNSRDKLRSVELKKKIEELLEDLLHNDPKLRKLQNERRRKALQDSIGDARPMTDVLNQILEAHPTLKNLLLGGGDIQNPFDSGGEEDPEEAFVGLRFPTYFKLDLENPQTFFMKIVPINRMGRLFFKTDAEDNYFGRKEEPGRTTLTVNGQPVPHYSVNLHKGRATVTIQLPETCKVGDRLDYKLQVMDPSQDEPFETNFSIKVGKKVEKRTSPSHERKPKRKPLMPPNVQEITKDRWSQHGMDQESALVVCKAEDEVYDFFVNLDNKYLLSVVSNLKDTQEIELIKHQYKYGMALIGLAVIQHDYAKEDVDRSRSESENDGEPITIEQHVYETTQMLSPLFIPMLKSLGGLQIEQLVSTE